MRKNFLILMLMALLPLAGWAQTDISGYQITLSATSATYTAADITLPTVTLKKSGESDITTGFTATWKFGTTTVTKATVAGDYVLTVTADETNTTGTMAVNTKTFTVDKATLVINVSDLATSKIYGHKATDFSAADASSVWAVETSGDGKFLGSDDATSTGLNVVVDWGSDYNAGEHTFTLSADALANYNVNFKPSATAAWTIDKKDLSVTAQNANITYGDTFNGSDHVTYAGFIDGEDESVLGGTLAFTTTYEAGSPKGTYSYQPSGLTSSNYNISYNNGVITVGEKSIAGLTIADFTEVTYNKTDQKPTAITASFLGEALEATTDYTLSYFKSATFSGDKITGVSDAVTEFKDANTYYVKIDGAGNFNGTAYKTFIVNKKPLALITKSYDAEYTGADQTLDNTKALTYYVSFDGLIGGTSPDEWGTAYNTSSLLNSGKTITLSLTKSGSAVTPKNVDEYTVTVTGDADAFVNYEPTYVSTGKFNITKATVTVTALDKSKKHGETHALDAAAGVQTNNTTGDPNLYTNWVTISGIKSSDAIKTYPVVKKSSDGTKTVASGLAIKQGSTDVTTKNYTIEYVDGTFTEGKGTISVIADSKKITYGDEEAALTATISGLADGELTEAIQAAVNAKVSIKEADHTDAGTYSLQIADVTDAFPADLLANYNPTINLFYESATYTVEKKELTKITANQQALNVGEAQSALAVSATTVTIEGLVDEADAADVLAAVKLNFASYVNKGSESDPKLTAVPTADVDGQFVKATNTYLKGIIFDTTVDLGNYKFPTAAANIVAGNLVVSAAGASLDLDAQTAAEGTANSALIAAKAGQKLNVKIANRKLKAGEWTAMTLPFAIKPFDFCTAIGGYAVFDLLEESGEALNFKININEIPAYTPFLIKADADVTLGTKTFEGVIVEAQPAAIEVKNDAYKFVGTIDYTDYAGPLWYTYSDPSGKIAIDKSNDGLKLAGFFAYIVAVDGSDAAPAPQIFIEEPNGNTTAISAITAEGIAIEADGWYSVNGVKLQGAPTEKGVYIRNGKKFVVK